VAVERQGGDALGNEDGELGHEAVVEVAGAKGEGTEIEEGTVEVIRAVEEGRTGSEEEQIEEQTVEKSLGGS